MPNFFSAFTTDVFRPLATLLIPGAIGVSTWFVAVVWHFAALRNIVTRNHTDTGFVLLLVTVFAGMVFEDFGARWEVQLDHWADRRTASQHTRDWWKYLQIVFKSDPVGRRYARALVLRLKFELGVAIGMVSAGLGLIWLAVLGLNFATVAVLGFLCLAFTAWGLTEATETHKVLSKTRAALLAGPHTID